MGAFYWTARILPTSRCTSGPKRHQLPTSRAFGFSKVNGGRKFARGTGDAASYSGTAARPGRGVAGPNGTRGSAIQPSLCTVGRRAAAPGNRAIAGLVAVVCTVGRAFFWN